MRNSLRVLIGVHAQDDGERLRQTLDSLWLRGAVPSEVLILADAPDPDVAAILNEFGDVRKIRSSTAVGAAAMFNRMIEDARADLFVFLESGCRVGPNWLQRLVEALDADQRHGIAGPSTNRAWNEQRSIDCPDDPNQLQLLLAAYSASRRFGFTWQTLEPLHSVADFCYAIRREVVDAIGGADEGYGGGPCWEMDYNVRADRAGFAGVWARAAFVYRPPSSPRRERLEAALFDGNKQLYQTKFCARQLRDKTASFKPQCEGDACEHFAPASLIEIRRPLPNRPEPADRRPLVSCVLATGGRPQFLEQSVAYYRRQTYVRRELIIIDDGGEDLSAHFASADITYMHRRERESLGVKRNIGCSQARGEVIALWDDDDWYGRTRLADQVEPLLADQADITALTSPTFFELHDWKFWTCSEDLQRQMFRRGVIGGTMVFWRQIWERQAQFPDMSLAEEAAFLDDAVSRGARLASVSSRDRFIYVRHSGNTWSFQCGHAVDPGGWAIASEPAIEEDDRAFYARLGHRA